MKKNTKQSADTSAPMDPSVREVKNPEAAPNQTRVCYAIKTLVSEVHELFPETPVEYSDYDGRNTALAVTFDLTTVGPDSTALGDLLLLTNMDQRVSEVIVEDGQALVTMRASARSQDSRDPFGLADAYDILASEEDAEFGGSL